MVTIPRQPRLRRFVTMVTIPSQPRLRRGVTMVTIPRQPRLCRVVTMVTIPWQPRLCRVVTMVTIPWQPKLRRVVTMVTLPWQPKLRRGRRHERAPLFSEMFPTSLEGPSTKSAKLYFPRDEIKVLPPTSRHVVALLVLDNIVFYRCVSYRYVSPMLIIRLIMNVTR